MSDWESLYIQLGQLVSEMPNLGGPGPITPEMNRWLGRAAYLVNAAGVSNDALTLSNAADFLATANRDMNAQMIASCVYRALAHVESQAPTAARGGFIGKGAALDALQIIGRIVSEAKQDLLIVDPYMDSKVFTDFAPTAASGVSIRLLSDSHHVPPSALLPAKTRWTQQFPSRPLEVRLAAPRTLHDRMISTDGVLAWTLTQSLKDLANRSPALAQKVDPDMARQKIQFYERVWSSSSVL